MTLSINWITKVIFVPKADLTLLQASPEIRELNLNQFRLWLKDIEDSEEGIPFLDTHQHNTEVTLSGLVYARIIEIINGYTVEFEDGQYTVICVGANHNIADVKVENQVSLIVNNAAGLISQSTIEFSSFVGAVWIDATSPNTGTVFPTGTPQAPVNNLADAQLIAVTRGLLKLFIIGPFTFGASEVISDYQIQGNSPADEIITVTAGCATQNTIFDTVDIRGTLSGEVIILNSRIGKSIGLSGFQGSIHNGILEGTITLAGSIPSNLYNCVDGFAGFGEPVIDFGGSGRGLNIRGYFGGLRLENKSGSEDVSINFTAGRLEIASDVTAGEIVVRGVGQISENLGTATVSASGLVNAQIVADYAWDEQLTDHLIAGSFGEAVSRILGITGENIKWTGITHDSNKNMTGATLTQYTDKTLTTIRKSWSLIATYNSESELTTYQLIED